MKIIPPISALIPWESYDYQGHIALYVTLEKIYELLNNGEDLSAYELQIEGEEDFSLLKDNKYLSLHQVKSGKIDLKENDMYVFLIQLLENDNSYGYFHINKHSSISRDFCKNTVEQINKNLSDLTKKVVMSKDIAKNEETNDYIVCEYITRNQKKGSVYSSIKYVISGRQQTEIDIDTVKDAANDICRVLTVYRNKLNDVIENSLYTEPDLKFWDVYPKRFDTNSEIKNEASDTIKKILCNFKPEYKVFINDDYVKFVYDNLFLFMKKKITEHINNVSNIDKCLLSFKDILDVITINFSDELNTKEYQYWLVLRAIEDVYAEYPQNCSESNCDDCCKCNSCNLRKQINKLLEKGKEERIDIAHNLILCEPQKGKSNNMPSNSLVSYLLCDVLKKVSSMKLSNKNIFQTVKDNLEVYRLTLDESRNKDEIGKKIKCFASNQADKDLLYETDVLVTDRLIEQNLVFNEDCISVLGEKELEELRKNNFSTTGIEKMKKECNRPKVIRLIDRDKAIGELSKCDCY